MASSKPDSHVKPEAGMRNVYTLGAVSFLTDVSTEMVFSVLPSYLVQVLGASKTELGLVEGIAEASSNILRMVSGYVSDWIGRRKLLLLVGYGLSTLAKPFFALARNWTDVLLVRFTDRVGKAVRTAPRDSLLSASVPSDRLGRAFGLHRTLDQSGAVLGPMLATLLLPVIAYEGLFYLSLLPGLLALLVLVFLVQEVATAKSGGTVFGNMREASNREFLKFLAVVALFSIGAFNFSFMMIAAGEYGVPEQYLPLVYMLINLVHAAVAIPAGTISDRVGRERMLAVGYGFLAATNVILLIPSRGVLTAIAATCAFGLYAGTVETMQRAVIPRYAEQKLRGTAYGMYYLTVGVSYLAANVVVGLLWDSIGLSAALTYSLVTSVTACLIMMFITSAGKGSN